MGVDIFSPSDVHLTNEELASIYDFVTGSISNRQLVKEIKRSRGNTYYYIGRACHYWIKNGTLKFNGVKRAEDLGGIDVDNDKGDK